MHAILYRSTATAPVSPADIDQILAAAARRNTLWGITGFLVYGRDADGRFGFAQWIEGEREGTESLFAYICADARHTDIERLADGPALSGHAPLFSGAAMRAVAVDRLPETVDAFLACTRAARVAEVPAGA